MAEPLPRRQAAPSELKIVHLSPEVFDDTPARRVWQAQGYATLRGVHPALAGEHPVGQVCQSCTRSSQSGKPA